LISSVAERGQQKEENKGRQRIRRKGANFKTRRELWSPVGRMWARNKRRGAGGKWPGGGGRPEGGTKREKLGVIQCLERSMRIAEEGVVELQPVCCEECQRKMSEQRVHAEETVREKQSTESVA